MRDINRVEVRGRLSRDAQAIGPEERPGTKMVILTNRRYDDRKGNPVQEVTAHNVLVWGKSALRFRDLPKGQAVRVVGKLHLHTWVDQAEREQREWQVIAQDVEVLGPQPRQQLGEEYEETPEEGR
jgi:single-stranded DNA-binding protein